MPWTCTCPSQNVDAVSFCSSCGQKRCPQCTFINKKSQNFCEVCGSKLQLQNAAPISPSSPTGKIVMASPVSPASPPMSEWTCQQCTFKNDPNLPSCLMCSSPRPTRELKKVEEKIFNAIPLYPGGYVQSVVTAPPTGLLREQRVPSFLMESVSRRILPQVEETRALVRNAHSVYVDFISREEMSLYQWGSVLQGLRPPHPYQQWVIFPVSDVNPDDILQGELGNCWFLSALSVLAFHHSDLIKNLFITKEINAEGVFAVKLCDNGEWKPFIIDATFPTVHGTNLKFARCREGNALWVPLLEKAYAKMQGGYQRLVSGMAFDAFYDLTGLPCYVIQNKSNSDAPGETWDDDWVFQQLHSYHSANCVMGASCGGSSWQWGSQGGIDFDGNAKKRNLITAHAYSVLQLAVSEAGEPLIQLRNPWGKTAYAGVEPPRSCYDRNPPKGSFWMPFSEFSICFSNISICKTRDFPTAFVIPNVQCTKSTQYMAPYDLLQTQLTFAVTKSTEVTIMATQKDIRRYTQRLYYDVVLLVVKRRPYPQLGCEAIFLSKAKNNRILVFDVMLDPGTYTVTPISFQCDAPINMTIYSESSHIQQNPAGIATALPTLPCNELLYQAIVSHPNVTTKGYLHGIYVYVLNLGLMTFMACGNFKMDGRAVLFRLDCSDSVGMTAVVGAEFGGISEVVIPPGHGTIIEALVALPNDGNYNFRYSYQHALQEIRRSDFPALDALAQNRHPLFSRLVVK